MTVYLFIYFCNCHGNTKMPLIKKHTIASTQPWKEDSQYCKAGEISTVWILGTKLQLWVRLLMILNTAAGTVWTVDTESLSFRNVFSLKEVKVWCVCVRARALLFQCYLSWLWWSRKAFLKNSLPSERKCCEAGVPGGASVSFSPQPGSASGVLSCLCITPLF